MTRAVIYVRISSDPKGEGLGVARQEADCRADCERRGWDVAVVEVDNDVSATKAKRRPGYERTLAALRDGVADALVVWSYDRLCRRLVDLEQVLQLVEARNLPIACVSGDLDISTPMGRTLARIIAAIAAGEVEQLKYRLRRKQQELAEAGKVGNGGMRPFGYETDRMTVREGEAEIVRELVDALLAGESLTSLARRLNDRGVPPVHTDRWSMTAVRAVVLKPQVAGLRVYQGKVVGEAVWPAIVDRGKWEALQTILRAPGRRPNSSNARVHLLSGLLTCGLCGSRYFRHRQRESPSYQCRTCHGVARNAKQLDAYIVESVLTRLADPALYVEPEDDKLAMIGAERTALEARKRDALEGYAALGMSSSDLATVLGRITTRMSELEVAASRARTPKITEGLAELTWEQFAELPLTRRRELVRVLFDRIVLHPAATPGSHTFDSSTVEVVPS